MKVLKYWKKEREIALYFQGNYQKERKSWSKGVPKILGLGKYSTHLHILIKVYDLHLLGSSFWLSNICDISMPLIHTYLKPHSNVMVRIRRRKNMSMRRAHSKLEGSAWWSKAGDPLGFNARPIDPMNFLRACQSIWPAIDKERKFINNLRWNMPVLSREFQVCRFESRQMGKID